MGSFFSGLWGEGHIQCTVEDVLENACAGDVILFSGRGGSSGIIRWTSPVGPWSHVGVILEFEGALVISEAYDKIIDRDVIRRDRHSGVQTVALEKRLQTYDGNIAWRPVRRLDGKRLSDMTQKRVFDRIRAYKEMPKYNMQLGDLLEYGLRTDDDANLSPQGKELYVCTSWVASVWQDLGIYQRFYTDEYTGQRRPRNPGRFLLADIGGDLAQVPWMQGWKALEIHFIN